MVSQSIYLGHPLNYLDTKPNSIGVRGCLKIKNSSFTLKRYFNIRSKKSL